MAQVNPLPEISPLDEVPISDLFTAPIPVVPSQMDQAVQPVPLKFDEFRASRWAPQHLSSGVADESAFQDITANELRADEIVPEAPVLLLVDKSANSIPQVDSGTPQEVVPQHSAVMPQELVGTPQWRKTANKVCGSYQKKGPFKDPYNDVKQCLKTFTKYAKNVADAKKLRKKAAANYKKFGQYLHSTVKSAAKHARVAKIQWKNAVRAYKKVKLHFKKWIKFFVKHRKSLYRLTAEKHDTA